MSEMTRYLAIDYGEKRVGLAISDPTLTIAQPLETLLVRSEKELIAQIGQRVNEHLISRIVMGLPLSLKGGDSQKTSAVRRFGERLQKILGIPLTFFDERFTTVQAQNTLRQLGKKPSRNRDKIDRMAAQFLLQAYLDREKVTG